MQLDRYPFSYKGWKVLTSKQHHTEKSGNKTTAIAHYLLEKTGTVTTYR